MASAPDLDPRITVQLQAMGQRIREIREAAGMSQSELARRSGVDRSHLNRIETGQTNASTTALLHLAGVFDLTPAAFFVRAR